MYVVCNKIIRNNDRFDYVMIKLKPENYFITEIDLVGTCALVKS